MGDLMYQALYRQYRPKTFEKLLGQEHITQTLSRQIIKGNIGHAYLFSGTRGTGKTSAAKIFSRGVNCLNPKDGNPCNECEICKGIIDESIMDVIEMDAASNNSVDDVRDLKEKVIYPPSHARYKVYIIDEVHMLSKGAFNALLKTLEEPPKHLIFILATTEPEKLPQTILSRCQRFDFKRITNRDIFKNMKEIIEELGINIEDRALNLIARNSDGAMRDALSLLDQCISYRGETISYEDATNILGIANKDLIHQLISHINEKDLDKALVQIDEIIQNGKDINQFIKDLIRYYRDLMIVKTFRNPSELVDGEDIEGYKGITASISLDHILYGLKILTDAETEGKWSTQPRIILEMAIIKLVNTEKELSLEERISRLEEGYVPPSQNRTAAPLKTETIHKQDSIPRQINRTENAVERPTETIQANVEPAKEDKPLEIVDDGTVLTFDGIMKDWPKVMQSIKTKKINIYALIMEGKPTSFENNLLTIVYDEGFGFHKEAVSAPQNKEFVEGIISTHFNKNITIHFYMKGEVHEKISKNDDENEKEKAIKEALDFFGNDIVEMK